MRYPPEIMKGLTPVMVMQVLSVAELSGLEAIRRIKDHGDDGIDIPEGTIYPLLYRLEKQGLVSARWREGDGTRRVRVYALTAKGRKQFASDRKVWLDLLGALRPLLGGQP